MTHTNGKTKTNWQKLINYLEKNEKLYSICHNCIREVDEDGGINYISNAEL